MLPKHGTSDYSVADHGGTVFDEPAVNHTEPGLFREDIPHVTVEAIK
jgi:hypothetical protein